MGLKGTPKLLISFLFGMGFLAFVISIGLEIQANEPMYAWLALIGTLISITATFISVLSQD